MLLSLMEVTESMLKKINVTLAASALALMAACAQAPQQAIDAANQALEAARSARCATSFSKSRRES